MSSSTSLSIPILTLEPPTPLPPVTPTHEDLFGSTLPIPFLDSLNVLDPFEDEKIDYNFLSPPGPHRRRRRPIARKPRPAKASLIGISLLGIAAIILFTCIASLTSPLHQSGGQREGFMDRIRGKMHVALALDVQGGAMLRDMTMGDLWLQVTHRERISDDVAEPTTTGSRQVRALSNDAWVKYREKRSKVVPAAGLDPWDFH